MGFSANNDLAEPPEQKPLGITPERTSTNEQGRPLPYFAGMARLSLTWLTEPWDVRTTPIRTKVGKKKQTTGYNYFCKAAAIICHGPVDHLDMILFDDVPVWTGPMDRSGDYADITLEGKRGTLRLYWGTATQELDPQMLVSGVSHPAYRRQCYAVFDLFLGANKTSAPNIEFVMRRYPSVPWLTTSPVISGDANLAHVFAELWTNPVFGLGLSEDLLDKDQLNAAALRLAADDIGASPVLNSASSFNQFLTSLAENIDGFPRIDPATGKVGLALVRDDAPVTAWAEADLVEPPGFDAGGWDETFNQVTVRFTNRDKGWSEDAVPFRDRGNFAVTGSTRAKNISRPWITRQLVAWRIAAAIGKQSALPAMVGTAKVRRSKVANVKVGDVVTISHGAAGIASLPVRITELTVDSPEAADIGVKWVEDRGFLNTFATEPEPDPLDEEIIWTTQPLFDGAVIELPFGYLQKDLPSFLFVAVRGDGVSNGFNAYWERKANSFVEVGGNSTFCLKGVLNTELPANAIEGSTLDVTFTSPDWQIDDISADEALANHALQVFAGNEIMLGYDPVLTGPKRYTLKLFRAWFGTRRLAHDAGAPVYVLQLGLDPAPTWSSKLKSVANQGFKLQPYLFQNELDLADCPKITHAVQGRAYRPAAPTNLRVFDDGAHPFYTSGQNIVLKVSPTSELRFGDNFMEILPTRATGTVIQILDMGGVLKHEIGFRGTTGPFTIGNALLQATLGAETNFKLRAFFYRGGLRSVDFDEITVRKA